MHRLNELLDLINSGRPRSKFLNGNVLRQIFLHLLPPADILESSLSGGGETPSRRAVFTLCSLTLVCKAWHVEAYPLLYQNITLLRVGQLVAFARTLRSSPETFGHLVQNLTISCDVPRACFTASKRSIAQIFAHCTHIRTLSFRGFFPTTAFFDDSASSMDTGSGSEDWPPLRLPNALDRLRLHDDAPSCMPNPPSFSSLISLAMQPARLVSLSVHISSELEEHSTASFPHLETLCIWTRTNGPIRWLPVGWELPKLTALRFRCGTLKYVIPQEKLREFCMAHGHGLRSLDLGSCDFDLELLDVVALQLCPQLEHLVINIRVSNANPEIVAEIIRVSALALRQIPYVDIVVVQPCLCLGDDRELFDVRRDTAWKHVRFLHNILLEWIPDLPYLFPPDDLTSEPRLLDYYGFRMRVERSTIALDHVILRPIVLHEFDGWSDTNSDQSGDSFHTSSASGSEYEPYIRSEFCAYSTGDESEAEPEDFEHMNDDPEHNYDEPTSEQMTEEEILALFSTEG